MKLKLLFWIIVMFSLILNINQVSAVGAQVCDNENETFCDNFN